MRLHVAKNLLKVIGSVDFALLTGIFKAVCPMRNTTSVADARMPHLSVFSSLRPHATLLRIVSVSMNGLSGRSNICAAYAFKGNARQSALDRLTAYVHFKFAAVVRCPGFGMNVPARSEPNTDMLCGLSQATTHAPTLVDAACIGVVSNSFDTL